MRAHTYICMYAYDRKIETGGKEEKTVKVSIKITAYFPPESIKLPVMGTLTIRYFF